MGLGLALLLPLIIPNSHHDCVVKPLLARPLTAPSPLKPNRAELRVHDPWAVYRRVMSLRNLLWPPSGLLHRDSPECILPEVEHELRKLSAPDSDPEEGVREEEGRRRTASARKLANPVSMMTALPASALSNDTHSPDYAPSSNPNVQVCPYSLHLPLHLVHMSKRRGHEG